tara:strand:+ start:182 stop:628 length:447 start_codon:yes stop_codon:yes gene_type:complete
MSAIDLKNSQNSRIFAEKHRKSISATLAFSILISIVINIENLSQSRAEDFRNAKLVSLSIKNGQITFQTEAIKVTQGTKLTLAVDSDKTLSIHVHGYDLIRRIVPHSISFLTIDTFATGRFAIKAHMHATENDTGHEPTLTYLEVYPD